MVKFSVSTLIAFAALLTNTRSVRSLRLNEPLEEDVGALKKQFHEFSEKHPDTLDKFLQETGHVERKLADRDARRLADYLDYYDRLLGIILLFGFLICEQQ